MTDNPYDVLGVTRDATPEDIKRAYRKKAAATHPDREGGDQEEFQRVNAANIILSDPEKREQFDRTGNPIAAVIIAAFDRAINEAGSRWQYTDIVKSMLRFLRDDVRQGDAVNKQMADQILQMEKWKARITHKGERNLIADHLSRTIEQARRNIATNEATMDRVKQAIDHVEEYGWEVDAAPTQTWDAAVSYWSEIKMEKY